MVSGCRWELASVERDKLYDQYAVAVAKLQADFQIDGVLSSTGAKPAAKWEPIAKNRVRFYWSDRENAEFQLDYIWSRFGDPEYPRADDRIVR